AARFVTSNTSPQVQVGSVRITAGSSSVIPQALAIFSMQANNTTISEASVPGSVAGSAFRTYVEFSPADQIDAGVAIANASTSSASVNLEITTLDGLSAGVATSVQIPAGGQLTKFVSELFPGLPSGLTGVLRISSATPISVIGLRARYNERGTFLIT